MSILKKITGWFLIVFALGFSVVLLMSAINSIAPAIKEFEESTAYGIGFSIGTLLMIGIFALLIIYFFRLGLKMIKPKGIVEDSIDDIGTI